MKRCYNCDKKFIPDDKDDIFCTFECEQEVEHNLFGITAIELYAILEKREERKNE